MIGAQIIVALVLYKDKKSGSGQIKYVHQVQGFKTKKKKCFHFPNCIKRELNPRRVELSECWTLLYGNDPGYHYPINATFVCGVHGLWHTSDLLRALERI